MKLWLATAVALVFFSGCSIRSSSHKLQNQNARQALLIQRQKAKMAEMAAKLEAMERRKKRRTSRYTIPQAPKKDIKLKKVEDNNYSSGYMYPKAKKKKKTPVVKVATATTSIPSTKVTTTNTTTMNKAACIAMIGQAKFDKYTQMFGGEAGSIKRCKMLKAMK